MRTRSQVLGVATAVIVLFLAGFSYAGPFKSNPILAPVDDLAQDVIVEDVVEPITGAIGSGIGGKGSVAAPTVTSDDDLAGHDTPDPESPDHASGGVLDADLAGSALADGSVTRAEVDDSDRAAGDATVLSLLGSEIIGAHSSSDGTTSEEFDILGPICDASGGALCVQLLWASTTSTQDASTSSSQSHTALAFVCLGGTATNADHVCDGPIGASVGESHSGFVRDRMTGSSTAAHSTDAADLCLGGEDPAGLCSGLGANVLHAAAAADTSGFSARDSQVLGVEVLGENNPVLADPLGLAIMPDCPPDLGVLCLYLNQGEDLLGNGAVGAAQQALHLSLLNELVLGHVSTAEALVSQRAAPGGPTCNDGAPIPPSGVCPPLDKPPLAQVPGGLPVTGGDLWLPFAMALNLIVAGWLVLAWDRRNRLVSVA